MKLWNDFGVRALFGTIIIGSGSITLCYLAWNGNSEAQTAINTLISAAVAFYFGQRSKANDKPSG